ncbi:hypothetical protein [Acinetobacter thermotolerans]|uniref:hypothetical protein n=2 Tax=Acinetobacter thermotolerans TaxID=3151487 RepID=UPI00325A56EB
MNHLLDLLDQIENLEDQLRDHINRGVLHYQLLNDKHKWWMLCSALDVLGDTSIAFKDYLQTEFPKETGLKYIYCYGILQCFILQQDSLKHLYEVFAVQWEVTNELKQIRKVRNASIGHTVLNNEGGRSEKDRNEFNNFISRITINKFGFDLLRYSKKTKDTVYEEIHIHELLTKQLDEVIVLLRRLIKEIITMENEEKKKFENEKLVDLLPISYWFEKIHSIYDEQNKLFAYTALDHIQKQYLELKQSLENRLLQGEDWFNEIKDYLVAIELMRKSMLDNDEHTARICNFYLDEKNDYFKRLMAEIDEKYEIRNDL